MIAYGCKEDFVSKVTSGERSRLAVKRNYSATDVLSNLK